MVIRQYARCEECSQVHVLRIGIGAEPDQAHRFVCVNCGEEMSLELKTGAGTVWGPNTRNAEPDDAAPIVNLHPSFVFSKDELHSPLAFPSIQMGSQLMDALLASRGRNGQSPTLADFALGDGRHISLSEEWRDLRAAWSLTRNGKLELAARRMSGFLDRGAYAERPDGLADWLFRFAGKVGAPIYDVHFEAAFVELQTAAQTDGFVDFAQWFGENLSVEHGHSYFEMLKAYFDAFGEFSQVHYLTAAGVEVGSEHAAASTDFEATRMFYGNAFETFASHVETLTALNNLLAGRTFDQLSRISLADYRQLDKAMRFKAFETKAAFANICEEANSQLRNASHHGGLRFRRKSGLVVYRAGKGGQGAEVEMGYATYLARCAKLVFQCMVLLRLELLITTRTGNTPPI